MKLTRTIYCLLGILFYGVSLNADWKDDLKKELWDLGYHREEIIVAIQNEVERRQLGVSREEYYSLGQHQKSESEEDLKNLLIKKTSEMVKKVDPKPKIKIKKNSTLKKVEVNHLKDPEQRDRWIQKEIQKVEDQLIRNDWEGLGLKDRLALEANYFMEAWDLKSNNEEDSIKRARFLFEEKLTLSYIKEASQEFRLELSNEIQKKLSKISYEFIDEPSKKRNQTIRQLSQELIVDQLERREKEFNTLFQYVLKRLKSIWFESSLNKFDRWERQEALELLCEDLAICDSEEKYIKVLNKGLKRFKQQGYLKKEITIIKNELLGAKPQ